MFLTKKEAFQQSYSIKNYKTNQHTNIFLYFQYSLILIFPARFSNKIIRKG